MHLLEWLHLVALGDRCGCGVCRHLDDLEQRRSIGMSWWLFMSISRWFVWGLVPSPAESQKATLVDCSCHSLVGRFLWRQVLARCVIPISRQTTKCWSTQQGLACRQEHELWEKNWFSCALDFSRWLIGYSLIGSSLLPWWYNHPTLSCVYIIYILA